MFAVCLPGLEHMLCRELTDLGIQDLEIDAGGVSFGGSHIVMSNTINFCWYICWYIPKLVNLKRRLIKQLI